MSRMKEMEKQLRDWRKEHPKTDLALSFVPYVGTALAAQDFAEEPTPLGAAGLALSPVAKMVKALRGSAAAQRAIEAWHLSPHKWDKWNWRKVGTGNGQAYPGPGISATRAGVGKSWADSVKGDSDTLYRYVFDIPDDEVKAIEKPLGEFVEQELSKREMIKLLREYRKAGHKTLDTPIPTGYGDYLERQLLIVDPRNVKLKNRYRVDLRTGEEMLDE